MSVKKEHPAQNVLAIINTHDHISKARVSFIMIGHTTVQCVSYITFTITQGHFSQPSKAATLVKVKSA